MNKTPSLATLEQLAFALKLDRHPVVLDVSTPGEYHAGHIEGAIFVPVGELDPGTLRARTGRPGAGRYETLYLTSRDGARAHQAADRLVEAGYNKLAVLDGGTQAWERAGLPMVRRAPVPTLDRQVQVAIGTLVLIPVFLGFTIHELFFAAIPLIAAGLIVAGATGWSGMARLLALMPWNRSGRAYGRRRPENLKARARVGNKLSPSEQHLQGAKLEPSVPAHALAAPGMGAERVEAGRPSADGRASPGQPSRRADTAAFLLFPGP